MEKILIALFLSVYLFSCNKSSDNRTKIHLNDFHNLAHDAVVGHDVGAMLQMCDYVNKPAIYNTEEMNGAPGIDLEKLSAACKHINNHSAPSNKSQTDEEEKRYMNGDLRLLSDACKNGDMKACRILSVLQYERGDMFDADELARKACEGGETKACKKADKIDVDFLPK